MATPRTFWVGTLGCKVNAADGERIARHLEGRGLVAVGRAEDAELRVVNTCSVTTSAAAQSRAMTRKAVRLPVFGEVADSKACKVLVTGCWATSDTEAAKALPGVDGVITHQDRVEVEIDRYLSLWRGADGRRVGLEILGQPRPERERQRAYLKVQDGCDAHCTYCIIPKLRTTLWSLPVAEAVTEVRRLVGEGYREVILTGIFLGAYGQETALRRRQGRPGGGYLAGLVRAIGEEVPELGRLRLSSLEPGDMTGELMDALAASPQVVPHFHLPLQSGSNEILGRMNRQYSADDFGTLVDELKVRFDRPALTTDVVTGFPGEDDGHWAETMAMARRAGFMHVHAFPFSARPGTAAARWTDEFVPSANATARVAEISALGEAQGLEFRRGFVGETVGVIVEKSVSANGHVHGRCERYFDVELPGVSAKAGEVLRCRVDSVAGQATFGFVVG